jgi:hypothetical protein
MQITMPNKKVAIHMLDAVIYQTPCIVEDAAYDLILPPYR